MSLAESHPEYIGPYRILGLLGEGAMGRVYRAEQDSPHREVALKLSGATALSAEARRRFEREIELLGALEHPDIARLYGGGLYQTALGEMPYLVMELVRGQPLGEAARDWPLRRKLELLVRLARAVHYAHTRGVVHRDLKPANVLVTAEGAPKVLDFGLARARDDGDGEGSQLTRAGEILGTLPYMAWEQLAGEPGQADPRVDVYALGVIAYELLSGVRPHPELPGHSIAAALEVLRREAPQPLAQRVPVCRGDLNTIVMKALAREPGQRYESALGLASDLERYLAGQPIEARPPTVGYVLGLFVRRHRALTGAMVVALLALVAGVVVSTRYGLAEARARDAAERRAAQLDASTRFLEDMLTSADPENAQGREVTVKQLLEAARVNLDGDVGMAPAVRALVARAIGMSYAQLGDTATGLRLLDQADAAFQAAEHEGSADDLYSRQKLSLTRAQILVVMGEYQQSLDLLAPLIAGPVPADELGLRQRLEAEQVALVGNGNLGYSKQALDMGKVTAALAQARLGPTDKATLISRLNVATMHYYLGQVKEAQAAFAAVMPDLDAGYGKSHPFTLIARQNQANTLRDAGDLEGAIAGLRGVVADMGRVLGENHYTTLSARLSLGRALAASPERLAEAETVIAAVYEQYRLQRGEQAHTTLMTASTLAQLLSDRGEYARAERLYREQIAVRERMSGGDSAERLSSQHGLAQLLLKTRRLDEAEAVMGPLLTRALASEQLGAAHPTSLAYQQTQAEILLAQGKAEAARALLERAAASAEQALGLAHARTGKLLEQLVAADAALGREDLASADRLRLQQAQKAAAEKKK